MDKSNWIAYFPMYLAWAVSLAAGVSFLFSARGLGKKVEQARGIKKYFRAVMYRASYAAGLGLILWTLYGMAWFFMQST